MGSKTVFRTQIPQWLFEDHPMCSVSLDWQMHNFGNAQIVFHLFLGSFLQTHTCLETICTDLSWVYRSGVSVCTGLFWNMLRYDLMCVHTVTHHQQWFLIQYFTDRDILLNYSIPFVSSSSLLKMLDIHLVTSWTAPYTIVLYLGWIMSVFIAPLLLTPLSNNHFPYQL